MFTKILLALTLAATPYTVSSHYQHLHPNQKVKVVEQQRVGVKPYTRILDERQVKCLADNIYFEARNEKDIGKKAVAFVTLNRIGRPEYPNTVCDVVYHKTSRYNCQFSWTCTKNRKILYPYLYNRSKQIAKQVLMDYGYVKDVTNGATFFRRHNAKQHWERNIKVTFTTRNHVFYKI